MPDQFPRPPADDAEREACRNLLAPRVCQVGSNGADGWLCTRRPGHAGKHVTAGTLEINGPVLVLATWPDAPAAAPAAVVLRGRVHHRFGDGVLSVTLPATFQASPRVLYVSPDELPGAKVGDRVTLRIEVDNG